jgi:hypothetical protein
MGNRRTNVLGFALAATWFAVAPGMLEARDRTPAFQGIMVEEGAPPPKRAGKPARAKDAEKPKRAETKRAAKPRPRGSSTSIPPPVPSPNAANSPPPPSALAPGPGVYQPPRTSTFGDRVTNCIHSAPLNAGVGNNPADTQAYVRHCAN